MPHYDALVLTLCISSFDGHKVLVDPGSAANLLQLLAFNQMRLSLGVLNSSRWILSSFNGATTVTLEDVTLPVRADPITQQVMFLVVGDLGPYNAIMGQAWLHSMKVVHSTYHQMVSYLTNVGQVDLLGNQLPQGSFISYICRNREGGTTSKVLPSRIKPPRSNHSSPPRLRQKRRIRWPWIP